MPYVSCVLFTFFFLPTLAAKTEKKLYIHIIYVFIFFTPWTLTLQRLCYFDVVFFKLDFLSHASWISPQVSTSDVYTFIDSIHIRIHTCRMEHCRTPKAFVDGKRAYWDWKTVYVKMRKPCLKAIYQTAIFLFNFIKFNYKKWKINMKKKNITWNISTNNLTL